MRTPSSVSFSFWQASFLSSYNKVAANTSSLIVPIPLISKYSTILFLTLLPEFKQFFLPNFLSTLWMVFAAIILTSLATIVARKIHPRLLYTNLFTGIYTTLLFIFIPAVTEDSLSATPASLSVFLALSSLVFLFLTHHNNPLNKLHFTLFAGLLGGLAAANHPSFFWLLFLELLTIVLGFTPSQTSRHVFVFIVSGTITASLPLTVALGKGESFQEFLNHALRTPYATIGDAMPSFGYATILQTQIPYSLLGFAIIGIVSTLINKEIQKISLFGTILFLMFGPFLPSLINHYGSDEIIHDTLAPFLIALSPIIILTAIGITTTIEMISPYYSKNIKFLALHLLVLIVLFLSMTAQYPKEDDTSPKQLAKLILHECPPQSILLTYDPTLTSLLLTTQTLENYRTDVDIVPIRILSSRYLRTTLHRYYQPRYKLDPSLSLTDKLDEWRDQQPWLVEDVVNSQKTFKYKTISRSFTDLALWEFIRENATNKNLVFIDYPEEWLAARLTQKGIIFIFPNNQIEPFEPRKDDILKVFRHLHKNTRTNSSTAQTLASIFTTHSVYQRKQGNLRCAVEYARFALQLSHDNSDALKAYIQARARDGDEKSAIAAAENYIFLKKSDDAPTILAQFIKKELELYHLEQRLQVLFSSFENNDQWYRECSDLTATLWKNYEFHTLAQTYTFILSQRPDDPFALYQLAAVYAQLGNILLANTFLTRALEIAPGFVATNLSIDGRFALLHGFTLEPES